MASLNSYLLIFGLNVNGLNAPIKWHRVADWIKRHDPFIYYLQETHFEPKDRSRLKVKGWRTIFHANGPQKKDGVAIRISDRLDFKLKTVVRDTEGHYIILKGCIQQEDITIINIYAPNRGAARYTSQVLTRIKRHIDKNTLTVGDLNTPLSAIDRALEQKTNIETRALNAIPDELDLVEIYRTLHPRTKEYSFYSMAMEHSQE